MPRISLNVTPEMYDLIASRARDNRRTMSKEVLYMIEVAQAAECRTNVQLIRRIMQITSQNPQTEGEGNHLPVA